MNDKKMKGLIQFILVLMLPAGLFAQTTVVSQISKTVDNKAYLEVDGKPFLYNSVQAWKSPTKEYLMNDYPSLMEKADEAGYRIFSFWLYWRDLEPQPGKYDWSSLDAMVEKAKDLDMRLDIIWGGSNFCGHLDPRFAPDWLLDWDEVLLKDAKGEYILSKSGDFGQPFAADCKNKELLKAEKKMLSELIEHLKKFDKSHRVVFFQVLNEVNLHEWTRQSMQDELAYLNKLGAVLKEADYKIATRANVAGKTMYQEIDELENIDCYGPDPYTDDIDIIRRLLNTPTGMPFIAENAAYKNTTSLMITSFVNGSGYNLYMLGPDLVWENPGVYDLNWEPWEVTYKVFNLNSALNKIASLLAKSSKSSMVEFNTEESYPLANYEQLKTLDGHEIGMKTWGRRGNERNGAVGMVLFTDGYYYLMADRITSFLFKEKPVEISSGSFNDSGKWVESIRKYCSQEADLYNLTYHAGECIRVKLDVKK